MFRYIKYIVSYTALFILWVCIIVSILKIFNIVEMKGQLLIPIILSGIIYHKYKPMKFKEHDKVEQNE